MYIFIYIFFIYYILSIVKFYFICIFYFTYVYIVFIKIEGGSPNTTVNHDPPHTTVRYPSLRLAIIIAVAATSIVAGLSRCCRSRGVVAYDLDTGIQMRRCPPDYQPLGEHPRHQGGDTVVKTMMAAARHKITGTKPPQNIVSIEWPLGYHRIS